MENTHKVEGVVLDEIRLLSNILPPKRMKELMQGNAPQEWGQVTHDHAVKVLEHIKFVSEFYFDFNNTIMGWNETFKHPGINPRGQASVVPQLVDIISRKFWKD